MAHGREDVQIGVRPLSFLGPVHDVRLRREQCGSGLGTSEGGGYSLSDALVEARDDQEHRTQCCVPILALQGKQIGQASSTAASAKKKEKRRGKGTARSETPKYQVSQLTHEVRAMVRVVSSLAPVL